VIFTKVLVWEAGTKAGWALRQQLVLNASLRRDNKLLALGTHVRLGVRRGAALLQWNAGSGGSAETKSLVRLIQYSPCNGTRYNIE